MTRQQAESAAREILVKAKNLPSLLPELIADALMESSSQKPAADLSQAQAEDLARLLEMAIKELQEHNAEYHHRTSEEKIQALREAVDELRRPK